jgi:dihydrofolate reductase
MLFKITLIILQSLDGFIAKGQGDDLSWGSGEDKNFFRQKTKEIGVMIMGSKTFLSMPEKAFSDRFSLVMTKNPKTMPENFKNKENIHFFDQNPHEAIEFLIKKGFKSAALIGGGQINNSFLKAGLINEVFVTIAPKIFGKGISSFGENQVEVALDLLEIKKINSNEILIHYKVNT